jgi:hypothetical protein
MDAADQMSVVLMSKRELKLRFPATAGVGPAPYQSTFPEVFP